MQLIPSYAVYDDDTPDRSPRMWNCSQGLFLALENVRVVRNHIINPYVGDTFAIDRILPSDPVYPFCNRIGELRSDPHHHWGYRFAHGGRDVSVWIEKMPATPSGALVGSDEHGGAAELHARLSRRVGHVEYQHPILDRVWDAQLPACHLT